MIQLIRPPLSVQARLKLQDYQSSVDAEPGFAAKVAFAKVDFPRKNQPGNITFNEIKARLKTMCSGADRCHYCEDSKADEVEHLLPKDAYPELCYSWSNYFYSCGPCNTKKNNQCAVIDKNGQIIDTTPVKQKKNSPINIPVAPQAGTYAFINPETENPMDFFMLDIRLGSFEFSELEDDKTSVEYKRANHTLEVLQLHKKEHLRKGRQHAYGDFKARLAQFIHCRNAKALQVELDKMKEEIQTHAHPTVWKEMIRQKDFISELKNLFDQSPEALLW